MTIEQATEEAFASVWDALEDSPTEAANMFRAAWDFTVNAVSNVASFFTSLING